MTASTPGSVNELTPSAEGRLQQALAAFQQAHAQGQPPDRDTFLSAYTDIALPLARILDAWLALHNVQGSANHPQTLPGEVLGDFRLLREIGRGGMGIVYEAVQESLGRRVAVKVLGRTALSTELERLRFRQEAQATALLQHPNIVPVYFVGEERDILYYAMRLIDGSSLAGVLAERRPLPEKEWFRGEAASIALAVRRIEQAALTLHFAHEQGFVHRDVKPANLLLDSQGQVWLTDFGLAFSTIRDGDSSGRSMAGTPGYISPEQLGLVERPLDRRADVFALGVTLFELLTLRTPFPGNTHADYRRALLDCEAPSARHFRPDVPRDLATILHKALARNPEERYPTALALAEDLRRFLECRPIQARPVRPWQLAGKWLRRHPRLTSLLGVVAVAVLVGLGFLYSMAREHDVRLQEREASLRKQRQYAERLAQDLVKTSQQVLSITPKHEKLRLELLEKAAEYYDFAVQEPSVSPECLYAAAQVQWYLGNLYSHQGKFQQSLTAMEKAVAGFEHLANTYPDRPQYRFDVFHALSILAHFQQAVEHPPAVYRATNQQALEVIERLAKEYPEKLDYCDAHATAYHNLGLADPLSPEAEHYHQHGMALAKQLIEKFPAKRNFLLRNIVRGERGLYQRQYHLGKFESAAAHLRAAIQLHHELEQAEQEGTLVRRYMQIEWASWQNTLITLCHYNSHLDEALARCQETLLVVEKLVKDYPADMRHQDQHIRLRLQHGDLLNDLGRPGEAEAAYRWFLDLVNAKEHPVRENWRDPQSLLLANCPVLKVRNPAQARQLAQQLCAQTPTESHSWFLLGLAEFRTGQHQAARVSLLRALDLKDPASGPEFVLALLHAGQGQRQVAQEWYDKGLRRLQQPGFFAEIHLRRLRQEAARALGLSKPPG